MSRPATRLALLAVAGLALGGCSSTVEGSALSAGHPSSASPASAAPSWDQLKPCAVITTDQQRQLGITQSSSTTEDYPDETRQSEWKTRDCHLHQGDTATWDLSLDVRNYQQHPYKHAPLPGGYTDSAEQPITVDGRGGAQFNQGDLGDCHTYIQLTAEHSVHIDYGLNATEPGDASSKDPALRKQQCDQSLKFTQLAVANILKGGG